MSDCIFCKIVRHEIPAKLVYEDDKVICFHDISPAAPVHVLIVPKVHYKDILALNEDKDMGRDLMAAVLNAVDRVAKDQNVDEAGFRLINNCGEDGGQSIDHVHFHLIGGIKLEEKLI